MRGLLPILMLLAACSKDTSAPNAISRDDLKSELRLATSYAVEANILLGLKDQKATTFTFDSIHLNYWTDKVTSEWTSLNKKRPSPDIARQYGVCVDAFGSLKELGRALTERPRDTTLRDSVLHVTSILVPMLVSADSTL
jgi:hypothetical protein